MTNIKLNISGSEKQIAWAESIMNTAIKAIATEADMIEARVAAGNLNNNFKIASDKIKETMITDLVKITSAKQIIDYRNFYNYNTVSKKFKDFVTKYVELNK